MKEGTASTIRHKDAWKGLSKVAGPLFLVLAITVEVCMILAQEEHAMGNALVSQFETDPTKGRDFRELSVHPNSEDLLFVECSRELDPAGGCYVLRYNLTTKNLQRYALPGGYFYKTASFSPRGNYVLMSRVPKTDRDKEKVRQSYENAEIVMMKTDGMEFKILQLTKGNKVAPVMSQDEMRVAYWRAALRPPGSKTFSSNYDAWEVNLNTGQDNLFAGPFAFFERSNLQYLSQDEMLVGAYGPKAYARSMFEYDKKYNHCQVYRIQRGVSILPEPVLTEIEYARNPSIDPTGNIYFHGQRPGISLFKKSPEGTIEQWVKPHDIGPILSLVAAPDSSSIAFTYEVKGTRPADGRRGIGLLNTHTSDWKSLSIPSLQSSTPIVVKAAN